MPPSRQRSIFQQPGTAGLFLPASIRRCAAGIKREREALESGPLLAAPASSRPVPVRTPETSARGIFWIASSPFASQCGMPTGRAGTTTGATGRHGLLRPRGAAGQLVRAGTTTGATSGDAPFASLSGRPIGTGRNDHRRYGQKAGATSRNAPDRQYPGRSGARLAQGAHCPESLEMRAMTRRCSAPSSPGSTRTRSPGRISPLSRASASGSCSMVCSVRRKGRAPKSGS
jgi:hypothetical protein